MASTPPDMSDKTETTLTNLRNRFEQERVQYAKWNSNQLVRHLTAQPDTDISEAMIERLREDTEKTIMGMDTIGLMALTSNRRNQAEDRMYKVALVYHTAITEDVEAALLLKLRI